MKLPVKDYKEYTGALFGEKVSEEDGYITVNVKANSGEIWLPEVSLDKKVKPIKINMKSTSQNDKTVKQKKEEIKAVKETETKSNKSYEEMTVSELQNAIIKRMEQNGPVTERMRQDVLDNVYHNSLVSWIKSFK